MTNVCRTRQHHQFETMRFKKTYTYVIFVFFCLKDAKEKDKGCIVINTLAPSVSKLPGLGAP